MDGYIEVGKTRKTYGVAGELKVFIEAEYLEDFLKTKVAFLEIQGSLVPYFVEEIRSAGSWLVKWEDVQTRDEALALTSKPIYLRRQDILEEQEREFLVEPDTLVYAYLADYTLLDLTRGVVGRIKEVQEYPQQEMAIVEADGKEILIPLHEQLIRQIDTSKQTITLELPDGLLNL